MAVQYDPEQTRQFYEQYGDREWERLVGNAERVVNFHVHRHLLDRFIRPGDRVLEAGAGPGRFTLELARLGARVVVGDISPTQLELNRQKVQENGAEGAVESRTLLDIVDLSAFATGSFDAVVCYGGPLSYVFDRAEQALSEMLRVLKPGGVLLFSVMSRTGSTRQGLGAILEMTRQFGLAPVDTVNATGDLLGDLSRGHRCHMFLWSELKGLLDRQPCTIEAAAASGCLSVGQGDLLTPVMEEEPELWERFLAWELMYCLEPGAVDSGTHMIAVVRRT